MTKESAAFNKHLLNTCNLFRAIAENGYDCEEAEKVRDQLDITWNEITDEQRNVVGEVSALFNELWDEREYFRVKRD